MLNSISIPDPQRRARIWALALPIIGGMTSQNILNLVDTWMVGALGAAALAGVGLSSFVNFMAVAVITGMSSAVQATASRRFGEEKFDETAIPLNGGLILSLCLGVPIAAILIFAAPHLYPLLNSDPAVAAEGVPYLQWRLAAICFIGMNFSFRGYWSAINMAKLYLFTLVWMHGVNIALSYVLIFGKFGFPEMGSAGAGLGTSISIVIGTATYFFLGMRHAGGAGFLKKLPSADQLKRLLKLGLPNSVQQLLFAGGFTALFWIIGQVGTRELATANVLVNLTLLTVLPSIGFGLAAASLSGQALGRKDVDAAAAWPWDVFKVSLPIFALIGIPMLICPRLMLDVFLRDDYLVELGVVPLRLIGAVIFVDGLGLILMNSLLGAGASGQVMRVATLMQWGLFLPIAYVLGPVMGFGLTAIWIAMMSYRGIQALIFVYKWKSRSWADIEV